MIVVAILATISVVLVVHVSILAFKQKKKTDMIIELYEDFMQELEKEREEKRAKKNGSKRN